MTKITLQKIIRETVKQLQEADRPQASGAVKPRGLPPKSWGGRRVYNKETGEAYNVVDFRPNDPSEPVQMVVLALRSNPNRKIRVNYNDYLSKYSRHSGDPTKTPIGHETPGVAAWAHNKLTTQGKVPVAAGSDPIYARGHVDPDPDTGEYRYFDSSRVIDTEQARTQDEVGIDKINLASGNPKLYDELSKPYVNQYKEELKGAIIKAQRELKRYAIDVVETGELEHEEKEWLMSKPMGEIYAIFWELESFHNDRLPTVGLLPYHISTISTICNATHNLDIANLDDPIVTQVIKGDPGFRTWLGKVDHGKLWNDMRAASEEQAMYRGQF